MKEPPSAARAQPAPEIMSELRVSGHLMRLEPGLFCVVQTPTPGADAASGLPGVRLSLPPGSSGNPDSVQISGFGPDGWLSGRGDAALVRVTGAPAQVLVTIYQARDTQDATAPNLQVRRLLDASGAVPPRAEAAPAGAVAGQVPVGPDAAATGAAKPGIGAPGRRPAKVMEIVAHIQERGDQGAMLGEWLGERGSKRWIEGFGIAPTGAVAPKDIEYQAVLGAGWLSPWVEGGQFCGSRGMALPLLGLRVRLRGEAAATFKVSYAASFIDGTQIGPVGEGEPCEASSLAAMESFRIELQPIVTRPTAPPPHPVSAKAMAGKAGAAKAVAAKAVAAKAVSAKAGAGKAAPDTKPPGVKGKKAKR